MQKPLGQHFKNDRRITKAKKLVKEALSDYQKKIVNIRGCMASQRRSYKKELDRIGQLRGWSLFFPYEGSGLGNGALVELADGSIKYDFITGIGVHLMGHSHPDIIEANMNAAVEDIVMQGNLQLNSISGEYMDLLIKTACSGRARLKHCFLTTSGAMANENALKIIFQKKHPARRLLAFKGCFIGRTLCLAQITDRPDYRVGLPKTLTVDYIPFFDVDKPMESTQRAIRRLKDLLRKNKGQYAGMCFELIQGEKGSFVGNKKFFVELMKILKKQRIAIMVDEIQTFGRTSQLFAFRHFGLDQYMDVVTIGKMSQACATLFSHEYNPKPGLLSQTFTASTSALYAGKVTVEKLLKGGYFGNNGRIARLSKCFIGNLEKIAKEYPDLVKGPFGLGAMIGFTYGDGSKEKALAFLKALYNAGVMGFVAGQKPMRIRFLMPVGVVTFKDIDHVCQIIKNTLNARIL